LEKSLRQTIYCLSGVRPGNKTIAFGTAKNGRDGMRQRPEIVEKQCDEQLHVLYGTL
jgi:hypothetical protein